MQTRRILSALPVALLLLASCHSDESLNEPAVIDPMFRRYVAMGNSITAGFQSGGINDSTQQRSYAALLAQAMGTFYNYPRLNARGCPPPFTVNVTQARVGGGTGSTCDLRVPTRQPLTNVAVPGNQVGTLLSNFGSAPSVFDPLKTIFLGGRTEVQLMRSLQPTFVTVWIGNNDVLGAFISTSNAGDTTQIVPVGQFVAQYDSVAEEILATGANVALVTVANVTSIPFASSAAIYFCAKNGGCPPPLPPQDPRLAAIPTFNVALSCAPPAGVNYLVPWPVGLRKVDSAAAGFPKVLDCTDTLSVISPEETTVMLTAIAGYNQHIASVATANGWALFDINPAFAAELQSPANPTGRIPPFPNVDGAFANPRTSILFGPLFSLDGVHPSSLAHQIVADSLASAINQTYGTSLPVPVCGTVTCPAP